MQVVIGGKAPALQFRLLRRLHGGERKVVELSQVHVRSTFIAPLTHSQDLSLMHTALPQTPSVCSHPPHSLSHVHPAPLFHSPPLLHSSLTLTASPTHAHTQLSHKPHAVLSHSPPHFHMHTALLPTAHTPLPLTHPSLAALSNSPPLSHSLTVCSLTYSSTLYCF